MPRRRVRIVFFSTWGSDYRQIDLSATAFVGILLGAFLILTVLATFTTQAVSRFVHYYRLSSQNDNQKILRNRLNQTQAGALDLARRVNELDGKGMAGLASKPKNDKLVAANRAPDSARIPAGTRGMEWNETEKWSAGKGKLESQVFYGQGGGAYIDDEDNIYPSLLDSRHEELTALPPHAGYGDSANVFTSTDLLTQLEVRLSRTQQLQKTIVDKFEIRRKQLEHTPSIKPLLSGRITDLFGKRKDPFIYRTRHHQGLDIGAPRGTEVFAPASGVVELVKNTYRRNRGYGKAVVINHGYGIKTLYGHLSEIKVKLGQRVERWDLIGLVGDTGRATGPHLHYEVWVDGDATDPLRFILNN